MILRALDEQPGGGVGYLRKVAVSHPVAFLSLLGRVLPLTMQGNPDKPVAISFAWASDAERPALTQDGAEVKDDAEVEQ
jgi:hypothetical protein